MSAGINIGVPQLSWTTVTPFLAALWLKQNIINRPVRHTWVKYLAKQMRLGRFERVTDAIGFRHDGMLINGQHRLMACIEAQTPFDAIVVSGLTEGAFQVTDRGINRTLADVTKMPKPLIADAGMCWRLSTNFTGGRIAEEDITETAAWWSEAYEALAKGITLPRGLSGSPVRVGFGARWALQGTAPGRHYVRSQFQAMMASDTKTMSRATAALWKRILQEKYAAHGHEARNVGAAVCFYCSDPQRSDLEPAVRDVKHAIAELREVMTKMAAAFLAAKDDGSEHPYRFAKDVRQTAIAPRKSARRQGRDRDYPQMSA
jgi:hypothetical protein